MNLNYFQGNEILARYKCHNMDAVLQSNIVQTSCLAFFPYHVSLSCWQIIFLEDLSKENRVALLHLFSDIFLNANFPLFGQLSSSL